MPMIFKPECPTPKCPHDCPPAQTSCSNRVFLQTTCYLKAIFVLQSTSVLSRFPAAKCSISRIDPYKQVSFTECFLQEQVSSATDCPAVQVSLQPNCSAMTKVFLSRLSTTKCLNPSVSCQTSVLAVVLQNKWIPSSRLFCSQLSSSTDQAGHTQPSVLNKPNRSVLTSFKCPSIRVLLQPVSAQHRVSCSLVSYSRVSEAKCLKPSYGSPVSLSWQPRCLSSQVSSADCSGSLTKCRIRADCPAAKCLQPSVLQTKCLQNRVSCRQVPQSDCPGQTRCPQRESPASQVSSRPSLAAGQVSYSKCLRLIALAREPSSSQGSMGPARPKCPSADCALARQAKCPQPIVLQTSVLPTCPADRSVRSQPILSGQQAVFSRLLWQPSVLIDDSSLAAKVSSSAARAVGCRQRGAPVGLADWSWQTKCSSEWRPIVLAASVLMPIVLAANVVFNRVSARQVGRLEPIVLAEQLSRPDCLAAKCACSRLFLAAKCPRADCPTAEVVVQTECRQLSVLIRSFLQPSVLSRVSCSQVSSAESPEAKCPQPSLLQPSPSVLSRVYRSQVSSADCPVSRSLKQVSSAESPAAKCPQPIVLQPSASSESLHASVLKPIVAGQCPSRLVRTQVLSRVSCSQCRSAESPASRVSKPSLPEAKCCSAESPAAKCPQRVSEAKCPQPSLLGSQCLKPSLLQSVLRPSPAAKCPQPISFSSCPQPVFPAAKCPQPLSCRPSCPQARVSWQPSVARGRVSWGAADRGILQPSPPEAKVSLKPSPPADKCLQAESPCHAEPSLLTANMPSLLQAKCPQPSLLQVSSAESTAAKCLSPAAKCPQPIVLQPSVLSRVVLSRVSQPSVLSRVSCTPVSCSQVVLSRVSWPKCQPSLLQVLPSPGHCPREPAKCPQPSPVSSAESPVSSSRSLLQPSSAESLKPISAESPAANRVSSAESPEAKCPQPSLLQPSVLSRVSCSQVSSAESPVVSSAAAKCPQPSLLQPSVLSRVSCSRVLVSCRLFLQVLQPSVSAESSCSRVSSSLRSPCSKWSESSADECPLSQLQVSSAESPAAKCPRRVLLQSGPQPSLAAKLSSPVNAADSPVNVGVSEKSSPCLITFCM
ncbi:hypothetical protein C7M84_011364 [Penaeus vannamei]|uniref:Uncharacterized protein n=1 Tax=Penaeus vannamei TaxID=6689 RepID=A0A3R7M1J9_PENVA|nr:hypothetical protein C7M84_011364 [Penaeus vannamei]